MGRITIKEIVSGLDINSSLYDLYIEKDAVPEVQEFLRNAVGEKTCIVVGCWGHRSASEAQRRAARLLRQVSQLCNPTFLVDNSNNYSNTPSPIVSRASIQSTLEYIRLFSDSDFYSAPEVEEAAAPGNLYHYWNDDSGHNPKLCSYGTSANQICKYEKGWIYQPRLVCE